MRLRPYLLSRIRYGAQRALGKAFLTLIFPISVAVTPAFAEVPEIVALGDSLTAGYGLAEGEGFVPQLQAWLHAQGVAAQVVNAGVSGDTSAGGLSRLDWSLTPETDALIVTLGGNDLLRGLKVLLVGLPGPANFGPEWKAEFDAIFPELAAKHGAALAPNFLAGLGGPDPAALQALMQPDQIHPNAEGVKKIVAVLGPQVQALLAE